MSRPSLLSAYEKLAALLGKLPGSLQEPILKELDPIRDIFLRQRPARIAVVGDAGVELPAFVNALASHAVLHAPLLRGPWTTIRATGTVEIADLRASGALAGEPADLFLFLGAESPSLAEDAVRAAAILSAAPPRADGTPAGLVVVA
jgi:hypothetical protein